MTGRTTPYADRREAGEDLASRLGAYSGRDDVVVLALPRGGVPVAAPVARVLRAPLDVLVVRKLGLPAQPEVAMGAVAAVGDRVELVRDERLIAAAGVTEQQFRDVHERELVELRRRESAYRDGRPGVRVANAVAVVVDDGLATGSTMRAALAAVRHQQPARLVVAVPVGSAEACAALGAVVDAVVCAWSPEPFSAVGRVYRDFAATQDDEVRTLLREAAAARGADT